MNPQMGGRPPVPMAAGAGGMGGGAPGGPPPGMAPPAQGSPGQALPNIDELQRLLQGSSA